MTDLLQLTAELVDIPSVSHDEAAIAEWLERELRAVPWLDVERLGSNVVARTNLGRSTRLVLAGHTDTVPVNDNDRSRLEGDVCWGLGSADMKGGLAVFLELARTVSEPAVDVTYVFYECEEVAARFNGLTKLLDQRPDLVAADAAILGEPTGGELEAGCQGALHLRVVLRGARAHTARPWTGRNAIHRAAPLLERVAAYEGRRPVIDGIEYREALQVVKISGGVAGNVVPDEVTLQLNHRFAPDRDAAAAEAHVREVIGDAVGAGDGFEVIDVSPPAAPALDHPLIAGLADAVGRPPRAKLGWTDVAFFASQGIPAINYGPGDPLLAHTRDERVDRPSLEEAYRVLRELISQS